MMTVNILLFIFSVSAVLPEASTVEFPTSTELAKKHDIQVEVIDLPKVYESDCKLVSFSLPKYVDDEPEMNEIRIRFQVWEYKISKKIVEGHFEIFPFPDRYSGTSCLPIDNSRFKVNVFIKYDYPLGASSGINFYIEDLKKWYAKYVE